VPNEVDPSRNVTVPLALGEASLAVNVTFPPYTLLAGEALNVRELVVAVPEPLVEGVKKMVTPEPEN
jgi:hypothetical protein